MNKESVLVRIDNTGKAPNEDRYYAIRAAKHYLLKKRIQIKNTAWPALCHIPEFVINKQKRTVVCLLKGRYNNEIMKRGTAKCPAGDVWNEDIMKAAAIGKALGEDVTKFEHAPQPETAIFPSVVETFGGYTVRLYGWKRPLPYGYDEETHGAAFFANTAKSWIAETDIARVIDDTNAAYYRLL